MVVDIVTVGKYNDDNRENNDRDCELFLLFRDLEEITVMKNSSGIVKTGRTRHENIPKSQQRKT